MSHEATSRIKIVVGTRGSELALRAEGLVVDALQARWLI